MNHPDHVRLLRGGVAAGVWADVGSGSGAFTLALADVLGAGSEIYSIDRDAGALREQARTMQAQFPTVTLHTHLADFTRPLNLPLLDGIVAANALHFVREKAPVIHLLKSYLKPGGRLVVVEYNVDSGNVWVPHPFSFGAWEKLAQQAGLVRTQLLATQPSRFLKEIYSAVSFVPA